MTDNNLQSSDFISVNSLKESLTDFFRIVFRSVDVAVSAVNRRKALFLLCCIAGLGAGYLFYLLKGSGLRPPSYTTEMAVQSNGIDRHTYGQILKSLNNLAATGAYTELAAQMKINPGLAQNILKVEGLTDAQSETDTARLGPFRIQVTAKENVPAATLENGLLYYLNNHPYVKRKTEGLIKIYQERLQFIHQEQTRLEVLKESYNRSLAEMRMPATVYNNALNPADLYRHSLDLARQKDSIQQRLNNESEGVLLVAGLGRAEMGQGPSLSRSLLGGLAAGMALGLGLIFLAAIRKKVMHP